MKTNNDKPAAKQKVEKPKRRRDVDAAMIIETIKELKSDLEDGKGCSLASIRNHISREYGLRMGKERQTKIKDIIEEEFIEGRINMTNHDGHKINFLKRFDVVEEEEEDETLPETQ